MRIAGRQQAAARAVEVGRDVELADQLDRLLVTAAVPDLGAEQDAGPLGVHQQIGELLDIGGIADRAGGGPVVPRGGDDRLRELDLAVQHVARDLEIRWPPGAVVALARRHADHVGDPLGRGHAGRELGDRRHHVDVRQILERAHLVLGKGALAADVQDRGLGAGRAGDPGHGVGAAGAGGGHHAAEPAGLPRVAVGGMGGDLLVAHVDDPDAFVQAAVVDVDDVPAAEREDRVHAFVLERPGDQVTAGDDVGVGALPLQRIGGGRGHGKAFLDRGFVRAVRLPASRAARSRPTSASHGRAA